MVAMDGHQGPQEIGVGPEFFEWLTDPVIDGGGALFDFGCYGANLMTWLMDNERPLAVTALTQHEQAGDLPARRRRGDDPRCSIRRHRASCRRRGTGRSAERTSRSTASTGMPSRPAATNLMVAPRRCRSRSARSIRCRQAIATKWRTWCPIVRGERKPDGPVVAREQPDRHRDPRRRARVGAHGQDNHSRAPLSCRCALCHGGHGGICRGAAENAEMWRYSSL